MSTTDTRHGEGWRRLWRYGRTLVAPVLIWALLAGALAPLVSDWLESERRYDNAALQEWIDEARNPDATLAELVQKYVRALADYAELLEAVPGKDDRGGEFALRLLDARERVDLQFDEITLHLRSLGEPATKMYPGLLPLFPTIYRLEVVFDAKRLPPADRLPAEGRRLDAAVVWDSGQEPSASQYRTAEFPLKRHDTVFGVVKVSYQLHAWKKRQANEQRRGDRLRLMGLLALAATGLGIAWLMLVRANENEQQRQREQTRRQLDLAERQRLQEEGKRIEMERQLLEQKLATQAAESHAFELKSHLYASIGIMAGSYAHNIKNLLVRPNDLLRRCLESEEVRPDQERMLREVQQTLGTVTERLQQILHTVRRDPSEAKPEVIDLNLAVRGMARTWADLAADRWHLDLELELAEGPMNILADGSHLQQAVENLLFNARDATFERRNHLRDQARRADGLDQAVRRQKVIEAVGWRGRVILRTYSGESGVVLEVIDNGAGMTEEVRRRCTETHFSTKRDNALYQGHSTGMGLGLSFVLAIVEHHQARLEIESAVQVGTTFRVRFPATEAGRGAGAGVG